MTGSMTCDLAHERSVSAVVKVEIKSTMSYIE